MKSIVLPLPYPIPHPPICLEPDGGGCLSVINAWLWDFFSPLEDALLVFVCYTAVVDFQ